DGPAADEEGVVLFAKLQTLLPRCLRRDPPALARNRGQLSVESHSRFKQHERLLFGHGVQKLLVETTSLALQHAHDHIDAGGAQSLNSSTVDDIVRIRRGDHDLFDAGAEDHIDAGWSASVMHARLEGDVDGGVTRILRRLTG